MPTTLLLLLAAGLLLACGAAGEPLTDAQKLAKVEAMYAGYTRDFPGVADIGATESMELAKAGSAVFVDARTPAERAVAVIPGAVALEEVEARPEAYRGKALVGYCTISYRSGKAAGRLAALGLDYRNLRGGILAWTLSGGVVVDPVGRPVKRIHVYGATWNYPPQGYEAVY